MQPTRTAQQWSLECDPPAFLCTKIVFERDGDFFICESKERKPKIDTESIDNLNPQMILPEQIWPLLEEDLTVCYEPILPTIFIKRPRLTAYDNTPALACLLLQEARVCEVLLQNPHPNIVKYLGCHVRDGRIVGLCFQRYAETLEERKRSGRSIDKALVLEQIRGAIDHLHAIRLAHNDVKASNIMFLTTSSKEAVLVDFDSCAVLDGPLPAKRGLADDVGIEELATSL